MSKPKFDPSKPFEVVDEVKTSQSAKKPKFDKNKPFVSYIADAEEEIQQRNDSITKDAGNLFVHGASLGWSDEIAGALSDDYEKGRDERRVSIAQSKEKLPYVGPVIEGAGSTATTMLIPGARAGKLLTEVGVGIAEGLGENTDPDRMLEDAAWSAGINTAANLGGDLLKKTVNPPEDIMANSAGARGINYRKGEVYVGEDSADEFADRLKDPAGLAARLNKLGFFGMGNKIFKNGKYVRNGGLEDAVTPVSLESMMERVQHGVSYLGDVNKKLLTGKRIPTAKVKATLDQAAMDFLPAGEDYARREQLARELSETAFQDPVLGGKAKLGDLYLDAAAVEDIKRKWQKTVKASYDSGKAVSEITNTGVEARRKFATALDKLVDQYGGAEYAKNNDIMRDLYAVETLIHDKASRQRGYSGSGARLTTGDHLKESILGNTIYHPQADMFRARTGEFLRTKPGQAVEGTMRRTPMEFFNNTIPQQQENNRTPQSVPNLPEAFIRTPLPRSTSELMQKKNFVLGKVAQMMPEMLEAVQDAYEHEPERIGEIAQVLSMKMPHLFERDKYNRFDGRILSEKDKQKAIKDTLLRKDISSIEQAKIITRLNQEGLYDF